MADVVENNQVFQNGKHGLDDVNDDEKPVVKAKLMKTDHQVVKNGNHVAVESEVAVNDENSAQSNGDSKDSEYTEENTNDVTNGDDDDSQNVVVGTRLPVEQFDDEDDDDEDDADFDEDGDDDVEGVDEDDDSDVVDGEDDDEEDDE